MKNSTLNKSTTIIKSEQRLWLTEEQRRKLALENNKKLSEQLGAGDWKEIFENTVTCFDGIIINTHTH